MRKQTISALEAMMLIVGSVVGAGVLAIPFAVAQVGFSVGFAYLVIMGLIAVMLHLFLGEIALRTKEPLQIGGLTRKYVGKWAGKTMITIVILFSTSALVAYVIGVGEAAHAIFAGTGLALTPSWWSVMLWALGAIVVSLGVRTLAQMEFVFASIIFLVIAILAGISAPYVSVDALAHVNLSEFFLPFGIVLFAFHGTVAIPQVEELLPKQQRRMKKVIVLGGLLPMAMYLLFAWAVVGVTGTGTTEIATIGLGEVLGPGAIIFGNLFALFAMMTSFFGIGLALRRTYEWDLKRKTWQALALTLVIPLAVFLAGVRDFITTIQLAGAVFGSIEAILIIIMFWRARKEGNVTARAYALHYASFVTSILFIVFLIGGVLGLFDVITTL